MMTGWRCPSCGHVYAPSVLTCWNCPRTLYDPPGMVCTCPTDTAYHKMHRFGCPFGQTVAAQMSA